jgi:hypothetical protein
MEKLFRRTKPYRDCVGSAVKGFKGMKIEAAAEVTAASRVHLVGRVSGLRGPDCGFRFE